jgi:hypothetical protein
MEAKMINLQPLVFFVGIVVLVYVLVKGFKFAYSPPTLAVNAGNPAFTLQV